MQKIINFLIGVSLLIAVAMFAYAGFLYTTGGANESQITKAHKVFKDVFIGFLIAISAWLVIQTIISVVFDGKAFVGGNWNQLECSKGQRLMDATLGELIGQVIPGVTAPAGQISTGGVPICETGSYSPTKKTCVDGSGQTISVPRTLVNPSISTGSCAPNSGLFGANAAKMSCICGAESAGKANAASRSDVMRANGQAFSYGLYQINLTWNEVRCPGQTPLNCPNAFAGKNYGATIANRALYDQCVAAAQNAQCNVSTARHLLNNTPKGITNWSTYDQCKSVI